MSANPQTVERPPRIRIAPAEPKPVSSATIPREVKTEIENLRRLVQTIQDRLHVLARM